jgi:hypothetical protein
MLRRAVLAALTFLCPAMVAAHPPYEEEIRVITEESGRRLQLVRSYVDGVMMTDPVKLVVRDEDDRTVAETEYGRDLALICLWPPSCLVFRYDGLVPILPENIWWLQNGELRVVRSPALLALGVAVPLREHWIGYLVSLVLLAAPFGFGWLLWRPGPSRGRIGVLGLVGILTVPYLFVWFYGVVILSELSLALVIFVVCLGAGAVLIVGARSESGGRGDEDRASTRAGIGVAPVGVVGVFVIVGIGVFAWMLRYSTGLAFDEPPPGAAGQGQHHPFPREAEEIFATVAQA